ncbi:MAG: hypothetical protein R3211_04510 [Balneolaceae bacterium]|nr:hypothetical protein [Balneolaceae bacterium]
MNSYTVEFTPDSLRYRIQKWGFLVLGILFLLAGINAFISSGELNLRTV